MNSDFMALCTNRPNPTAKSLPTGYPQETPGHFTPLKFAKMKCSFL